MVEKHTQSNCDFFSSGIAGWEQGHDALPVSSPCVQTKSHRSAFRMSRLPKRRTALTQCQVSKERTSETLQKPVTARAIRRSQRPKGVRRDLLCLHPWPFSRAINTFTESPFTPFPEATAQLSPCQPSPGSHWPILPAAFVCLSKLMCVDNSMCISLTLGSFKKHFALVQMVKGRDDPNRGVRCWEAGVWQREVPSWVQAAAHINDA